MSLFVQPGFAGRQQPADAEIRSLLKKTVSEASSFYDKYDAEVWLVDMNSRMARFVKAPDKRLAMLKMIHQEATRAGLQPELVLSVIHVESLFNRFAVSRVGAQGIMQVMPFWKNEIGRPQDNLIDLATNLRYGCTILSHYIKKERGDLIRALARYNGSLGKTWYPRKVMTAMYKYWYPQ
ncbi:lytic transglycosylase domain-containing protein [Zooshikella ganghwensis]|uniref:lytic transglycosylase domain-containing protein n=1 Tax=Zooshikella ganghwensis TaxID=202772 RepID=UPI001E33ADBF|nr:lytic transglycosylase domain-containing protein [Zooshikella ganghwensis]